jgi:hypothetical protein
VGFLRNKGVKSAWLVLMFETDGEGVDNISGKGPEGITDDDADEEDDELSSCD